jgi:SAM-dependent methyltransferase
VNSAGDLGGRKLFPAEATIPIPGPSLRGSAGPPGIFRDSALTTMGRLNMSGLRPDHDVLDVGCGVGRVARFLCAYLGADASYEGFDVVPEVIEWCQTQITPLFPRFHFQFFPIFNPYYNPDRTLPTAAEFRFPYPDESFDFAFAHSVFTHLVPDAAENYLREIRRVLRPGGISYMTWTLFNDDPAAYTHPTTKTWHRDPSGTFGVRDPAVPEAAIRYSETFVRQAYASSQLSIAEPLHFGFKGFQDAIVALR